MVAMAIPPAEIVRQSSYTVPGAFIVTEHFFTVPLNYAKPKEETITIFARSAKKRESPVDPDDEDELKKKGQLPWLLFLQGGPGFECKSPESYARTRLFLDKGYQVLYMDPRGTGLSTPVSDATLKARGDTNTQVEYLKLFRADTIIKDCEAIRHVLTADYPDRKKTWSIMGQSFGGFCCVTYLSFFPHALKEVFIFGGLPPMATNPDDPYRRLWRKVEQRNRAYYRKYPDDVDRVKKILDFISENEPQLPSGVALHTQRFLQMGHMFGVEGGLDQVHYIILRTINEIELFGLITRQTLDILDHPVGFDNNLIYSLLHEPAYCRNEAPKWSAWRVGQELDEFEPPSHDSEEPAMFYGEMIFPWMFSEGTYAELQKVHDVAEGLANTDDWGPLYSIRQLESNHVPVYAAIYMDDMYVDFEYSMKTAECIQGCKTFVTNVMYHDGITSHAEAVIEGLWKLRTDDID